MWCGAVLSAVCYRGIEGEEDDEPGLGGDRRGKRPTPRWRYGDERCFVATGARLAVVNL